MDSRHSDAINMVACLRESALRGDWSGVASLTASLQQQALPADLEELGEYLHALKEALSVAKGSRAHTAASLGRLNAAARFRQNFGEAADS